MNFSFQVDDDDEEDDGDRCFVLDFQDSKPLSQSAIQDYERSHGESTNPLSLIELQDRSLTLLFSNHISSHHKYICCQIR